MVKLNILKTTVFSLTAMIGSLSWAGDSAQEEMELMSIYGDEEFISIATGSKQSVARAPAVASVVTRKEIEKIAARDIEEVLELVPGLHVAKDPLGYNPIITIRGIYSDFNPQVLMLIDGVPMTHLFHGDRGVAWGGMPVNAIERVEVIRGPGAAVYGADAFAGVINIITRTGGDEDSVDFGYRQGTANERDYWLTAGGKKGDVGYFLSYEDHRTDGDANRIMSDTQTVLDDFLPFPASSLAPSSPNLKRDNYDIRFNIDYKDWFWKVGYQDREGGTGAGALQAVDPSGSVLGKRLSTNFGYKNESFADDIGVSFILSYLDTAQEVEDDLKLLPPGTFGTPDTAGPYFGLPYTEGLIGNPEVWERHYRASGDVSFTGFDDHQLRLGVGYYLGDLYKIKETKNYGEDPLTGDFIVPGSPLVDVTDTPLAFMPEDDRENYFTFIQDVWQLANDWELTAGVRYDHYSDFGDTVNPRLALVWSTTRNLTTKLLYGEAFRAPSFAQTRAINNPSVTGNPELDPEELKSYELAFDYRPSYDLTFNLNAFHYKWEDIIQFVPDGGGSSRTAQNSGEQTGHGLEFEVRWQAEKNLEIISNVAWQKSTDKNLDKDAANSPEKQFHIRADWGFAEQWSLNAQANWVMDRNRAGDDSRSDVDNYVLVDLTLRRKSIWDHVDMALIVKNVFDEHAFEPSPNGVPSASIPDDLPLAGQTVLGEIRYRF